MGSPRALPLMAIDAYMGSPRVLPLMAIDTYMGSPRVLPLMAIDAYMDSPRLFQGFTCTYMEEEDHRTPPSYFPLVCFNPISPPSKEILKKYTSGSVLPNQYTEVVTIQKSVDLCV